MGLTDKHNFIDIVDFQARVLLRIIYFEKKVKKFIGKHANEHQSQMCTIRNYQWHQTLLL
jgi:hypothetical protein